MLGWIQVVLCISRALPHIKQRWGMFSAHSTYVQYLTAYRASVMPLHRSRTQNCGKSTIRQERGQSTHTDENRKVQLIELCDIDGEFPVRSLGVFRGVKGTI